MNINQYHKPFKDYILNFCLQLLISFVAIKATEAQTCTPFTLPKYGIRPLQCDNQRGSRCYIGCKRGYELVGNCFRICSATGEWTGSEPQCINRNILCPVLQVYNGLLEEDCPRLAGTQCNVRCDIDQIQRTLLCEQSGQWLPEPNTISCLRLPTQVISCPPVLHTPYLRLTGDCNPSRPQSICYFSCNNNAILNGPSAIQCANDGKWSGNQPFCVTSSLPTTVTPSRGCTMAPTTIENMGTFLGNCFSGVVGQPCVYTCMVGYALAGNPALICGENGQWQGTVPNCVQIFCKGLTDPTNGQVSRDCSSPIQNLMIGKVCTFTCNTNHQLRGNRVLTCQQNGQWDYRQPDCESIHCPVISPPSNARLKGDCNPGVAGSYCSITCPQSYILNGNNRTVCETDGTWSVGLGVCEQKLCASLPRINNGQLTGVCLTNTRVKSGQMCAYECNIGYQLNGPAILECLDTGLWSNSVPSCLPSPAARCAPLPIISCASMTGVCNDAVVGQVCRYVCSNYETCSGDVELTCTEDGTWQGGNLPSCESHVTCRSLKIQAGATFIGDCRPGVMGKTCTVACRSGYRLYGTVRTIVCLQSGSWSNSVPRCIPVPSNNQLESSSYGTSPDTSPQSSRCSSRVSRSPRSSRSAWARFRRPSTLGYEQTVMYGRYTEDLSGYAKRHARVIRKHQTPSDPNENPLKRYTKHAWRWRVMHYFLILWKYTFGRIGEDWLFLALLGTLMACLSFILDQIIKTLIKSRITLYKSKQLGNDYLMMRYFLWTMPSILLILFASGFVHLVSPQAVGSGIPEMKTILRGVVLKEYLTFKTLVAKMVGLAMALGSGLPLGKEGPFVHIASIVATLLSRLVASFKGIYENEFRTGEMLSAACAIGVASTFYSPIGGVLFSIEVTSVYFAIRDYWRCFFGACCGAAVWRLLIVWILKEEESITALFSTDFSTDLPFDPQELIIFCIIGVFCGFAGAGYVAFHRHIVKFNRRYLKFKILQKNRFIYPFLVTWLITSFSFPDFLGKYNASLVSTHDSVEHFFSNKTWLAKDPDTETREILKHWTTDETGVFFHLGMYIFMTWWTSALASTIAVPSGVFIPVLKIGAAFGRLVGELTSDWLNGSVRFGTNRIPIIPGGYAVVAAAAFSGAVTHTISTTVILFELTGQMTHIIPVIAAVLISNAIAQSLQPSIYDSIIQIKQLPFLPSIASTSSAGHHILVEDFMIRDVICIWQRCTYRELAEVITKYPSITCFPLVENLENMILLGSVNRNELHYILDQQIGRERRLEEFNRKNTPTIAESTSALNDSNNNNDLEGISLQVPDMKDFKGVKTVSTSRLDKLDKIEKGISQTSLLKRINSFNRKPSRFAITQIANEAASQSQGNLPSLKNSRSEPSSPKPGSQKNFLLTPRLPKSILKHNNSSTTLSPHSNNGPPTPGEFKFNVAIEKLFLLGKHKDAKILNEELATQSLPTSPYTNRRVKLPKERVIDMSPEEQNEWEEKQLDCIIDLNNCHIDPAPFQLVGHTSLIKVHTLFTMLQLNHTYVTSIGRLVGIVALKDLRKAIEKMNSGQLQPKYRPTLTPSPEVIENTGETILDTDKTFELKETVVELPRK